MITGYVVGVGRVTADLAATGLLTEAAQKRVIRRATQRLETIVKGKASGRPGPNAPTGDYRRSITHQFVDVPGFISGIVGTNAVQGRRLELGFVGYDSLGRYYDQPPYPHFGPGADEIEPLLHADHEAEITKALQ